MRTLCTNCGKFFDYSDAKIVKRKLYNTVISEKRCPYCGSQGIEPLSQWRYLDKFLKFAYSGIN